MPHNNPQNVKFGPAFFPEWVDPRRLSWRFENRGVQSYCGARVEQLFRRELLSPGVPGTGYHEEMNRHSS
jgi:hypothetical protein